MAGAGLLVLEYGWDFVDFTIADVNPHNVGPDELGSGWLVNCITFFAGPGATGILSINGHSSLVAPGGSISWAPCGAYRGPFVIAGDGARLLVDYWYKPAAPSGNPPTIVIT